LGQLGNLSNYSLSEIKQSLKKMRFEEIKIDKFIFLHVSDKHTEYILKYNQNGVLIKIEKDEWK
jgi:NAD kinase